MSFNINIWKAHHNRGDISHQGAYLLSVAESLFHTRIPTEVHLHRMFGEMLGEVANAG